MQNVTTIALSRLIAQQQAMDVLADNIANAGSPGYKSEHVLFGEWVDRQQGVDSPNGGRNISFVETKGSWRDVRQGAFRHTGNPLDLALGSDGYFTVMTPRGPRLTRGGRFALASDGTIIDGAGNALLDANGQKLHLAPTDTRISIVGDGTLSSQGGVIGRIGVVRPANRQAMTAEGNSLFRADTPTQPVAQPKLVQGAVEQSNVQPILEMTRMMTMLRDFQFVSQLVQSESDRRQAAINSLTQHTA